MKQKNILFLVMLLIFVIPINAVMILPTGNNFTETDTLQSVTDRGASTDNEVTVNNDFNTQFIDINTPAIVGRETLFRAKVSDAGNDQFGISSGSSVANNFPPTFYGYKESDYGGGNYIYSLNFRGLIPTSQDVTSTGDFGIINFETYDVNSPTDPNNPPSFNPINNRRLLSFRNGADYVLTYDPDYKLKLGTSSTPASIWWNGYSPTSSAFDDMAIGIRYDTTDITGLDFHNANSDGQVRFMARSDDGAYTVINAPGSNRVGTWLDTNWGDTHYIWTTGARDLALGTLQTGYDLIVGAGGSKAYTVDGADQRILVHSSFEGNTEFEQITARSGIFPVIDTTRTTSAQGDGTFDDLTGVASGMRLVTEKTNSVANDGTGGGFIYGFKDTSSSIISNFARTYARRDGANNKGMFQIGTGTDGSEHFTNFRSDGDTELPEDLQVNGLAGTYTGGSAYVCVYNNGTLYASESACP